MTRPRPPARPVAAGSLPSLSSDKTASMSVEQGLEGERKFTFLFKGTLPMLLSRLAQPRLTNNIRS